MVDILGPGGHRGAAMVKCPNCQAENEDAASACFLCGQPIKKKGWLRRILSTSGGSGAQKRDDQRHQIEVHVPDAGHSETTATDEADASGIELERAEALKGQSKEYLVRGEHQRAVEACSMAIDIDPNYGDAYYNLGPRLRKSRPVPAGDRGLCGGHPDRPTRPRCLPKPGRRSLQPRRVRGCHTGL